MENCVPSDPACSPIGSTKPNSKRATVARTCGKSVFGASAESPFPMEHFGGLRQIFIYSPGQIPVCGFVLELAHIV